MTSLVGPETSLRSPQPTFAPPPLDAPPAHEAAPSGIARRLLERFALLAFALYHVPLFLNNYPSLGGGGFSDTGLAPRWGHVFTPPGVWVARHVLHLTRITAESYRGDNGDVSEEFGRLLLCIAIGLAGAACWTLADRRKPRAAWAGEALRVLLRYSIALGLLSYGIAKLLPMQFPPLRAGTLEQHVGDLSPMALLWTFMEYSRPYAFFGGLMECAAVALLCVRRTATLGALVCLAVMTNVALLNYAYGVPVKLYSTMIALSAAVLVLYDAPRLIAVLVANRPAPAVARRSPFHQRVSRSWRWTIKTALVGSVAASSLAAMLPITLHQRDTSGLAGTWTLLSVNSHDASASPATWQRLTIDGSSVSIRAGDSTIFCGRRPGQTAGTLSRASTRARHGELRWSIAGDTLRLAGTFADGSFDATARRVEAPYPLLRSRFRLISE